ncbi:hypothetical protein [Yoonia sp. BS5-3]|uniref:Heme oxygenase n=1 Tax=Yoonia phaeophyticola TaxID=3137369 RepID=A0ABZ2V6Q5_9RHOB
MTDLSPSIEMQSRAPVGNRAVLKMSTRAAHEGAESRWFSDGRFASRDSYDHWLKALLKTHQTFGARAVTSTQLGHYQKIENARQTALCADLGCDDQATKRGDPPSDGWAWGVLYVLNGSALGASMLLKSNSIQDGWPTSYLRVMQGFASSGQLKSFFGQLDQADAATSDMAAGAKAVFDYLAACK